MEEQVQKIIDEQVRPALRMDGGDIELVGIKDNIVSVRLKGACNGCPSAGITLQMGVERILKTEIPEIESVVSV
jgi:Fe-S cluster biogenesis protein NfuA